MNIDNPITMNILLTLHERNINKKIFIFFQKGIDKSLALWYNIITGTGNTPNRIKRKRGKENETFCTA